MNKGISTGWKVTSYVNTGKLAVFETGLPRAAFVRFSEVVGAHLWPNSVQEWDSSTTYSEQSLMAMVQ
jgi:hypothetical protein